MTIIQATEVATFFNTICNQKFVTVGIKNFNESEITKNMIANAKEMLIINTFREVLIFFLFLNLRTGLFFLNAVKIYVPNSTNSIPTKPIEIDSNTNTNLVINLNQVVVVFKKHKVLTKNPKIKLKMQYEKIYE